MDLTFFISVERIEYLRSKFARQAFPRDFDPTNGDRDEVARAAAENSFFYLVNEGAKCFRTTQELIDDVIKLDLNFTIAQYEQAYPVMIIEINDKYAVTSKQGDAIFGFLFHKQRPQHFTTYCLAAPKESDVLISEFIADQTGKPEDRAIIALMILINTWLYRRQTNPDAWMFPRQREKNLARDRGYRDIQLVVPKQEVKLYQHNTSEIVRPGIGAGSEKCPHQRRAHTRKLRDKEGKILKEVPVRACKIHADRADWSQSSVTYLPDVF
jgi:hypothetical protein